MKKLIKLSLIIICLSLITGCATKKQFGSIPGYKIPPPVKATIPGFYHSVKKGQTMWRISHIYSIDMEKLANFNNISNTCKIEVGQKLFIPDEFRKTRKIAHSKNIAVSFEWPYKGPLASCFRQAKKNVNNQHEEVNKR